MVWKNHGPGGCCCGPPDTGGCLNDLPDGDLYGIAMVQSQFAPTQDDWTDYPQGVPNRWRQGSRGSSWMEAREFILTRLLKNKWVGFVVENTEFGSYQKITITVDPDPAVPTRMEFLVEYSAHVASTDVQFASGSLRLRHPPNGHVGEGTADVKDRIWLNIQSDDFPGGSGNFFRFLISSDPDGFDYIAPANNGTPCFPPSKPSQCTCGDLVQYDITFGGETRSIVVINSGPTPVFGITGGRQMNFGSLAQVSNAGPGANLFSTWTSPVGVSTRLLITGSVNCVSGSNGILFQVEQEHVQDANNQTKYSTTATGDTQSACTDPFTPVTLAVTKTETIGGVPSVPINFGDVTISASVLSSLP